MTKIIKSASETREYLIQELKKQKLLIKDEIARMNRNFNGKSYVKDGIESDF